MMMMMILSDSQLHTIFALCIREVATLEQSRLRRRRQKKRLQYEKKVVATFNGNKLGLSFTR